MFTTNWREVCNTNNWFALFIFSFKSDDIVLFIIRCKPSKTFPRIIYFIELAIVFIYMIELFCECEHFVVFFKIQKQKVNTFVVAPFIKLSELISHKCKFFTRMSKHIHQECSHQIKFLVVFSKHLVEKRFFSVNNFIVRNWQDEVFRECIKHWKCQFFVVIFSKERVKRNIRKSVIHPADVPLVIKPKSTDVTRFCNHWPSGWLLCNHQRVWIFC